MISSKSIVHLTRTLLRDTRARRTLMFYIALAAVLMVFIGSVLLVAPLRAHPLLFIGYWAVCAWFTVAAMLLAVFDLLVVRSAGRAARRALERDTHPPDDDSHAG
ncbi:MAG: hypothetical protein ABMA13_17325 [Chthoniobacteraceae bacterium]